MTKHDRLMNALKEIKEVCKKNGNAEDGCAKRCPFIMEADENGYMDCEIVRFMHTKWGSPIEIPEEWGESEDDDD